MHVMLFMYAYAKCCICKTGDMFPNVSFGNSTNSLNLSQGINNF